MKRINLLALGMAACFSLSAQAQLVDEKFEAEQTKTPTEQGYYKFVNVPPIGAEGCNDSWAVNDGVLNIDNDAAFPCDGQKWQRALKFFHLPIQAGKFYRVSFDITAGDDSNGYVDVKLMQGDENADICILGANGEEQRDNFQMVPGQTKHYSTVFFYADEAKQMEAYKAKENEPNYAPNEYFVNINVYNPGKYTLDNVYVEEVAFKSAGFASTEEFSNICIDYGKASNIKDLVAASEDPGSLALPIESVEVTDLEGTPLDIDAIELRADGKLYIFGNVAFEAETIKVKFTNPTDEAHKIVLADGSEASFEAEIGAIEDPDLANSSSWAWTPAQVVSMTPSNDSFNYDPDLKEVTVTFDHGNMVASGEGAVQATLDGTPLTIKEGTPEEARTITFVYNGENLANGKHTIIISNIASNGGEVVNEDDVKATFEVGKHKIAKTVYTEWVPTYVTGEFNEKPTDWTVMTNADDDGINGGTEKTEWGQYSGCRVFNTNNLPFFYLCNRHGKVYMMYGKNEGANLELPAGNIEFSVLAVGHEAASRRIAYQIEDMEGNILTSGDVYTGIQDGGFTSIDETATPAFQFVNPTTQNVVLKLREPDSNGTDNAVRIGGFKYRTFTKTEGETGESETIAEGQFGDIATDNTPANGSGWKMWTSGNILKNASASCGWAQPERDATSGSRCNASGNKGTGDYNGGIMYFSGGGEYATYGLFDTFVDRDPDDKTQVVAVLDGEGNPQPEKTLTLDEAKYQVSFYIGCWNPGVLPFTCEIYTLEGYQNGDAPIAKKQENTLDGKYNEGKQQKVDFMFDAPVAGRYVVKMIAGGEMVFGNFKLETTMPLPLQYGQMLDKALEPLVEEQGNAHSSENYVGDTRDAIDAAVMEYSDPDFHSIKEFEDAIKNCETLIDAMKLRRRNIDAYPAALAGVEAGLQAAKGTKYEVLEQFPIVENAYNTYKDVEYITLSDEDLNTAVNVMGDNGKLLEYMVNTGAPILTKQISDLVAAIIALDEEAAANEFVVAADNAVSDDQALVNNLKTLYAAKLYKKFAEVEDPFHKTIIDPEDPENPQILDVEYPADFLIQNPVFYCVEPLDGKSMKVSANAFPGWNISIIKGEISPIYTYQAWGGDYPTAVNPVKNVFLRTGYGSHEFEASQAISNIPVGIYEASIVFGDDCGSQDLENHGYAFCSGKENMPYEGVLQEDGTHKFDRDNSAPSLFEDVKPVVEEGEYTGAITLGVHQHTEGGHSSIDNATLKLTAKDPTFNYAAAAEALGEKTAIIEAIAGNQPAEAPISTQIISVDGKVGASSSIVIKIEKWANGFMKVTKLAK